MASLPEHGMALRTGKKFPVARIDIRMDEMPNHFHVFQQIKHCITPDTL